MPPRGKGKRYPVKPMAPDMVARFTALMKPAKIFQRPAGLNPHWKLREENINQLWRWDTLEDVEL